MLAISDQEVNGAVVDCHLETVPLLLLKVSVPLVAPKQTDALLIEPPTGVASTVGKVAVLVAETDKEQEAVATCVIVKVAPDCPKLGVTENVATPDPFEVGVAVNPVVAPME